MTSSVLGEFVLGEAVLADLGTPDDPTNQTVIQSLGLTVDATFDPVINRSINQKILTQTVEPLYRAVSQSLFSVSSANPDAYREIVQFLGFTDRKIFEIGNVLFSRQLEPGVVTEAAIASAANFIFTNPSQNNKAVVAYNAVNSFGFVEVIGEFSPQVAANALGFSQQIGFFGPQERQHTDGNFLRQSVSFSIDNDDRCRESTFAPLIGDSDDERFAEMLTTPPTLTPTNGVVLTYPWNAPTITLNLEPPDLGDDDTWNFTRIDRRTRGGTRKIFSDDKWAKWERLTLQMAGNTDTCTVGIDEIIDFLNASLGKEIGFRDWEGRQWRGFIVDPETDVIEQQEGFSFQLIFEGRLTTLEVQYGTLNVIYGQDSAGDDIEVIYIDD